jgi:hypothetical protein
MAVFLPKHYHHLMPSSGFREDPMCAIHNTINITEEFRPE